MVLGSVHERSVVKYYVSGYDVLVSTDDAQIPVIHAHVSVNFRNNDTVQNFNTIIVVCESNKVRLAQSISVAIVDDTDGSVHDNKIFSGFVSLMSDDTSLLSCVSMNVPPVLECRVTFHAPPSEGESKI
ncbi:hypothetical protein PCE1_001789 [Barthelona sp. PCE]